MFTFVTHNKIDHPGRFDKNLQPYLFKTSNEAPMNIVESLRGQNTTALKGNKGTAL